MYSQPIDNETIAGMLENASDYISRIRAHLPFKPSFVELQLRRIAQDARQLLDPYEIDDYYRTGDERRLAKHLRIGRQMMPVVLDMLEILYEDVKV